VSEQKEYVDNDSAPVVIDLKKSGCMLAPYPAQAKPAPTEVSSPEVAWPCGSAHGNVVAFRLRDYSLRAASVKPSPQFRQNPAALLHNFGLQPLLGA